jgi:hypothetical protein
MSAKCQKRTLNAEHETVPGSNLETGIASWAGQVCLGWTDTRGPELTSRW